MCNDVQESGVKEGKQEVVKKSARAENYNSIVPDSGLEVAWEIQGLKR